MQAYPNATLTKHQNREASAIVLLHKYRDQIFESLEQSENPQSSVALAELRDFLA